MINAGTSPDSPFTELVTTTMFVEVFGRLTFHHQLAEAERRPEMYSLCQARATELQWVTLHGDLALDRWSFHDGGGPAADSGASSAEGLLAWLQVGVGSGRIGEPARFQLPIYPMLHCAGYGLDRLGEWQPETVQVVLPLRYSRQEWHLNAWPEWLSGSLREECLITVTIDSGRHRLKDVPSVRQAMAKAAFVRQVSAGENPGRARESHIRSLWAAAEPNILTLRMEFPEWSMDAASWLLTWVAETLQRCGETVPVMVTVEADAPVGRPARDETIQLASASDRDEM